MCVVSKDLQKQVKFQSLKKNYQSPKVSETVRLAGLHDFPDSWPNLLPELISKMASSDLSVINGVLGTANALFKR